MRLTYIYFVPYIDCCCTMLVTEGLAGICMMLATTILAEPAATELPRQPAYPLLFCITSARDALPPHLLHRRWLLRACT